MEAVLINRRGNDSCTAKVEPPLPPKKIHRERRRHDVPTQGLMNMKRRKYGWVARRGSESCRCKEGSVAETARLQGSKGKVSDRSGRS
ncbi:L-amino-acid oxidase [Clarias magur]|uniref:L-amino-acid oxidase n=1 Tax=Clarias magur TaxID=1594786 RepID=A0A8J4XFT6_CLAMG|nr:L-amino-acid oxidase [Clarias magur]